MDTNEKMALIVDTINAIAKVANELIVPQMSHQDLVKLNELRTQYPPDKFGFR